MRGMFYSLVVMCLLLFSYAVCRYTQIATAYEDAHLMMAG
jgi:cbb3-type cytochrome oxidase subunit 3